MTTLLWILLTLAAIFLVSIATVVLIVVAIYRRIRRSRTVNGVVLRNRARFSWGPRRTVLALRVQLAEALDSGHAAIDLAVRRNGRRGELPRLFRRIESEGLAIDSRLRLLESEADSSVLAGELPAARLRVDQLTDMVRRLRASVASGLTDPTDDALTTLRNDLEREIAALHAGAVELHRLNTYETNIDTPRQPSTDRLHTKGAST